MRPDNSQLANIILGDLFRKIFADGCQFFATPHNKICVVIALNGVQNPGNLLNLLLCCVCIIIIYTVVIVFLAC